MRKYSAALTLMAWALLVSVTEAFLWLPIVLAAVVLTVWDLHRHYREML